MKNLRLFSFMALALAMTFTACKSDGSSAKDEARESIAAAPATNATPAATPAVTPATPPPTGPLTSISFTEDLYDYGEIMEGEKVTHEFAFTNTGSEPLIISNAKGSCGCTVPDWPRDPIAPGEGSVIKVVYDSKGKGKVGGGVQSKRVTITANTDPANTYLTIKGSVLKPEGAATSK